MKKRKERTKAETQSMNYKGVNERGKESKRKEGREREAEEVKEKRRWGSKE